jgi:hypothetical protein
MKALVKFLCWFVLDAALFGKHGTQEETFGVNLSALSAALHAWYPARHKLDPREKLTRVHDLTVKVVGTPSERKMGTKGAETYGLLVFFAGLLRIHVARLPAQAGHLADAASSLVRIIEIFKENGVNFKDAPLQECFDCMHTLYARTEDLVPDMETPKRHLVVHLLHEISWFGNPSAYSCFYDEWLNKMLKEYLRTVSQATFEPFVLLRMRDGLSKEAATLKRKAADRG